MAIVRNTGARGLRSILEDLMLNVMFEVPSRQDVSKCVITKEAVEKKETPILVTVGKKSKVETA